MLLYIYIHKKISIRRKNIYIREEGKYLEGKRGIKYEIIKVKKLI
jgi:hypothetical protein